MLKYLHNTQVEGLGLLKVLIGSAALVALFSLTPAVAPAQAQSAPDVLSRLDPAPSSNEATKLTDEQRTKVRSTYARSRKTQVSH
jgi:hypothetical protein